MVRLLSILSLVVASSAMADRGSGQRIQMGAEIVVSHSDAEVSWRDGGLGKLADTDNGLSAYRFYLDYSGRLADTVTANLVAEAFDDERNDSLGLTEAYLQWRPVPVNALRTQVRVGMFYPRLSLENGDPGWSSEFLNSFSAINSWVAEELRTFGAELDVHLRVSVLGQPLRVGLTGSLFWNNDPAGGLLAWRGWSLHGRQSRLGESLALAELPTLHDDGLFSGQAENLKPFEELDGEAGYTVGVHFRTQRGLLLQASHYDNRADPLLLEGGQYGWGTRFNQVGLRTRLPGDVTLVSQWMSGSTQMGPVDHGRHAVDLTFRSHFVLVSRDWGDRRASLRYDDFETVNRDTTPMDTNSESGNAVAIAYRHRFSDRAEAFAEWLSINARRDARMYFNEPTRARENRVTLNLRFSFDL